MQQQIHLKKRSIQGFTLIELSISSVILLATLALLTNQLMYFNRTAAHSTAKQNLEDQMRTTIKRLENEMLPAARVLKVHPSNSSLVTNNKRIILEIPAFRENGMFTHDGSEEAAAYSDLLIISKETDNDADPLRLRPNTPKPDKLVLTYQKSTTAQSIHQEISSQVIARHLMPSDSSGKYVFPPSIANGDDVPTFRFFTETGTEETNPDNYRLNAAMLRIVLWAEDESGRKTVTTRKELEIRLRNFKKDVETDL